MADQTVSRHIALFIPNLEGGGAERVMVMLANGLVAEGHRVDMVLVHATGPYLAELDERVRVVDLARRRVMRGLVPMTRYLRRHRPDVLLSALNHCNIIAIVARALAGGRVRLVVSEHNALTQGTRPSRLQRLMRTLIRHLYPLADAVVCVSRAMRDDMALLLGRTDPPVVCVYNPLDVDRVRTLMRAPATATWDPATGRRMILAAGRLTEQKDYPTLLRAFALLVADRRADLVILGQGDQERELRDLARELAIDAHVHFLGFQQNPFVFMAKCDLFVLSSRWEGLPGTLLEALACGARVVSTDCPTGPDEILEGGRWGRLVPVGDVPRLADAMRAALDDPAPPRGTVRADAFRPEYALAGYADVLDV